MKKVSSGAKKTAQIAKFLTRKILENKKEKRGATVLCLAGDLGAGKTTFTQAAARFLRIKNKIISPTFVIFKKYKIRTEKFDFFYHVDAYRLENGKELLKLGWKEIIKNNRNLIFIEWPENVRSAIPKDVDWVHIKHGEGDKRIFESKL